MHATVSSVIMLVLTVVAKSAESNVTKEAQLVHDVHQQAGNATATDLVQSLCRPMQIN